MASLAFFPSLRTASFFGGGETRLQAIIAAVNVVIVHQNVVVRLIIAVFCCVDPSINGSSNSKRSRHPAEAPTKTFLTILAGCQATSRGVEADVKARPRRGYGRESSVRPASYMEPPKVFHNLLFRKKENGKSA